MLYVKTHKALYRLLTRTLLIYRKLVKDLEQYGFELSPYNPCVVKKMIYRHHMTRTWHVNDLRVSHKYPFEVTKFACYLQSIYGKNICT